MNINVNSETDNSFEERISSMLIDVMKEDDDTEPANSLQVSYSFIKMKSEGGMHFEPQICLNGAPMQEKRNSTQTYGMGVFEQDRNCLTPTSYEHDKRRYSNGTMPVGPQSSNFTGYSLIIPEKLGNFVEQQVCKRPFESQNRSKSPQFNNEFVGNINRNKMGTAETASKFCNNLLGCKAFDGEDLLDNKVKVQDRIEMDHVPFLKGNFLRLIMSQHGSRILQRAIANTDKKIILIIFEEIKEKLSDLMVDNYANYFCQLLYKFLFHEERIEFLTQV